MGFSRQEYWSGLPLLSPRENTERFKMGNSLETHTKYHERAEMGYRSEHLKVLSPRYLITTMEQTVV